MPTIARFLALVALWAYPSLAQILPDLPARPSAQDGSPGGNGSIGEAGANADGSSASSAGSGAFDAGTGDLGLGGAGTGAGGFNSGLGGFAGASGAPPGIIGDYSPITAARVVHAAAASRFPGLPTPIPPPNPGGRNPGLVNGNGTTSILFKLTGLKISDNQSPIPQDRFFYSFNYFDNLNASVDRRIGSPIQNLQVYHQLFGLEKTFLDGRASIGFRVPLNTISFKSTANVAGLGGSSTSAGDLSVFLKYAVYRSDRFLASTGLQITAPTGPGAFGGAKYYSYFRDTQIQPFVGSLLTRDRFYVQGFASLAVPTTSSDVTMLFNDVAVGYFAYRSLDASRWLTAIVPTAEAHLNTPLNHRGFSSTDLASTPDVLDLTFGVNTEFRRRSILSVGYVTPVTGPKPFNAEFVLQLNVRFGGTRRVPVPTVPPPL
jgi:hypothetical protein